MKFFNYILMVIPLYGSAVPTEAPDMRLQLQKLKLRAMSHAGTAPAVETKKSLSSLSFLPSSFREKLRSAQNILKKFSTPVVQDYAFGAYAVARQFYMLSFVGKILLNRTIYNKSNPSTIPPTIAQAIKDLQASFTINNISVSPEMGLNAVAFHNGSIAVGKPLLEKCTPLEQRFVIGHEVTHVTHHHLLKIMAITIGALIALPAIHKAIEEIESLVPENSKGAKLLHFIKKGSAFINDNPFIYGMVVLAIQAYAARYFEKEADLVSATQLNAAQGGVDFFNRILKEPSTPSSWLSSLNPFKLLMRLDHALFPTHPSIQTRIQYLSALASHQ